MMSIQKRHIHHSLIILGIATFISVCVELAHILFMDESIKDYVTLIFSLYICGLVFSWCIVIFEIRYRKNPIIQLNYIFAKHSVYLSTLVFTFLCIYSFFGNIMAKHIFWFFPGLIFSTYYLHLFAANE